MYVIPSTTNIPMFLVFLVFFPQTGRREHIDVCTYKYSKDFIKMENEWSLNTWKMNDNSRKNSKIENFIFKNCK